MRCLLLAGIIWFICLFTLQDSLLHTASAYLFFISFLSFACFLYLLLLSSFQFFFVTQESTKVGMIACLSDNTSIPFTRNLDPQSIIHISRDIIWLKSKYTNATIKRIQTYLNNIITAVYHVSQYTMSHWRSLYVIISLGPILLMWFNFNPGIDK